MGSPGYDDLGIDDHLKIVWKALETLHLHGEQDRVPTAS